MNRQMRREAARAAKRPPIQIKKWSANKPMLHEVEMVFGPVDSLLNELSTGFVNSVQGKPVFKDYEGVYYEAAPALSGLISAMERIFNHYKLHIDLQHLNRLCNRLDAGMPINVELITHCQHTIALCKSAYRKMDVYNVKSIVNTELIYQEQQKIKNI